MDSIFIKQSLCALIEYFCRDECEKIKLNAANVNSDLRKKAYSLFENRITSSLYNKELINDINSLFNGLKQQVMSKSPQHRLLVEILHNWWHEWAYVYLMQSKVVTNLPVEIQNVTHLTHGNTQPLRQHELSHYANLFTQVPIPLCNVSTVTGDIIRINQRFVDVFGYTIEDVPTLEIWWLKAYPDPTYRKWVLETWQSAVEFAKNHATDIQPKHYQVTCKNGQTITMEISGIAIENEFLAIFKDATQQIAAEDILRDMAFLDSLTQIANRRRFDEKIVQEFNKAIQNNEPLSILLIDIDFFKNYNDSYGHLAGDECLFQVAQSICSAASENDDFVARYGGEEFVVILPSSQRERAYRVAEKIQQELKTLSLPHKFGETNEVTVSIGINTIHSGSLRANYIQFLEGADKALYKAKQQGRNSIAYLD